MRNIKELMMRGVIIGVNCVEIDVDSAVAGGGMMPATPAARLKTPVLNGGAGGTPGASREGALTLNALCAHKSTSSRERS